MACFLCSRCFRCAWPQECSGCRVDSGLEAVRRSRQTSQGYRWVRVGKPEPRQWPPSWQRCSGGRVAW